jgi:hypothetical protein
LEDQWNDTARGKKEVLGEKVVPLTLSIINSTWTGLESILVLHDERTLTNHLSCDMGKNLVLNCCAFLSVGSHKM